jgi:hypothetical protein
MAAYAEIRSSDNVVLRVVVVNDSDVTANGGAYSAGAEAWVASNIVNDPIILEDNGGSYPETYWKETSVTAEARYNYAGPGSTWDEANQAFISPQPFPSFTLDSNFVWTPPVAEPTTEQIDGINIMLSWDEANQKWFGYKSDASGNKYEWNPGTSNWDDTGESTVLTS